MSKKTVYPEELELAVIEFYLEPNSLQDCADKFNLTNSHQVQNILDKYNIPKNQYGLNYSEEFEKQVIDFYLTPNTLNETVRHFNKINNRQAVKNILKKYNIPEHTPEVFRALQMEKIKQTNLEKYGVECTFQVEEVKEKIKATNMENWGVEYPQQAPEIREKGKETLLKNYGRTNVGYFGSPEHDAAIMDKYGVKYIAQCEEIKEKIKQTNLDNYGVTCNMNTPEQLEKTRHERKNDKFRYEDATFDSFPELCFYMYQKLSGNNINRQPDKLEYVFNGETHYYFPDFEIDNELYEIKGRQFLKEDGTWQNPYDHSYDELVEAKHQCALQNNVHILYEDDYMKYLT